MPVLCQQGSVYHGMDVSYPKVILALQVDLRSGRDGSTLVRPGTSDSRRSVDSDLSTSREAVVGAVGVADQGRVVGIVAYTAASHWVGITVDDTDC